jgi:transketolase
MSSSLDQLCINTIRALSIDQVQKANSGHPGLPLGAAPIAYVIWSRFLRHHPANPKWINRDRFVLSAGHGSALLYSLLHLTGYDLSLDDLKSFRQWNSKTPGHPESHLTPGVEATTGPLGQGVGNVVGMAIAREQLAARFNAPGRDLISYRMFGLCSDGDLMEGVASEAASLAGHLGLGSIVLFYDDNGITIDGTTKISFTEDVGARFTAYGWQVLRADGLNPDDISAACEAGISERARPTLVICKTTIGYGAPPNKVGTSKVHGSPLNAEEVAQTKRNLGLPDDKTFYVPNEVFKHMGSALMRGAELEREWQQCLDEAKNNFAEFCREWDTFWNRKLPTDLDQILPSWSAADKPIATRKAGERVLNALAPRVPQLISSSADLAESNLTYLDKLGDFSQENRAGRNLRFGIREHAMGSILNGVALSAPFIPVASTFLVFLDYMKPAVRLAALSHLPVIFVFTHDSVGLGEDGPTHQPIEHLWTLRATPNLLVFRPADANETAQCWKLALERTDGPSAVILSRQNLPIIDSQNPGMFHVKHGAFTLAEASKNEPDLLLLATGSEVQLALRAREQLELNGTATRVISLPCLELFDEQTVEYRESVLSSTVRNRIAIEAGATCGWWKYVGAHGDVIGLDHFGASAPGDLLFEKFGFTVENVVERARLMIERNRVPERGVQS